MSQDSKPVEVDYLTEDRPIPGQEYGVYSFLSPDNIKGCTVRAFKNRGNFGSYEEASKQAERIRNEEPAFHVFVGENFKWTTFDPDPNLVKDNNNYYEPKLQALMKGNLENQEKAKQLESQRKQDMIESAIKEEINKTSKKSDRSGNATRDRLRAKLEQRNKVKDNEDGIVTNEINKSSSKPEKLSDEQYEKKKEDVKELNENLDKMKKLYADLLKKKQSSSANP